MNQKTKQTAEDLRTDFEREREEKWEEISDRFVTLKQMNPLAKPSRLFGVIAKERGMTASGVRRICMRVGVYSTQAQAAAGEAARS